MKVQEYLTRSDSGPLSSPESSPTASSQSAKAVTEDFNATKSFAPVSGHILPDDPVHAESSTAHVQVSPADPKQGPLPASPPDFCPNPSSSEAPPLKRKRQDSKAFTDWPSSHDLKEFSVLHNRDDILENPPLPSSFLNMPPSEALDMLSLPILDSDQTDLQQKSYKEKAGMLASNLYRMEVLLKSLVSTPPSLPQLDEVISHLRRDDAVIKQLQDQLDQRDSSLAAVSEKCSTVQSSYDSLQEAFGLLKASEESLRNELSRFKIQQEKEKTELLSQISIREREARLEGMAHGMAFFRDKFFLSRHGQDFLSFLYQELTQALLRSKFHFFEVLNPCRIFFKYGFKSALEQAREQGFQGKLNREKAWASAPDLPGWEGKENEPRDFPWWMGPIHRALDIFRRTPAVVTELRPMPDPPLVLPHLSDPSTSVIDEFLAPPAVGDYLANPSEKGKTLLLD